VSPQSCFIGQTPLLSPNQQCALTLLVGWEEGCSSASDDLSGPRCKWWAPLSTPLPHTLHTASRLIVTVPRLSRYQTAKPLLVLLQQQMMQVTVATTATVNICKLLASTGFLQNTSRGFPRLSTTFCGVLSMTSPGPCMAPTSTSFLTRSMLPLQHTVHSYGTLDELARPRLWKALLISFRQPQLSLGQFRRALKTYLFDCVCRA